jgi:hypothetical protein
LVGKPGDVQVEHIITNQSGKFDYPFVHINEVQPAGTWVAVKEPASSALDKSELNKGATTK